MASNVIIYMIRIETWKNLDASYASFKGSMYLIIHKRHPSLYLHFPLLRLETCILIMENTHVVKTARVLCWAFGVSKDMK